MTHSAITIDVDRLFATLPQRTDATFTDEKLHQQAIAKAKRKFRVYPSAYAGNYITQEYKRLYKAKHGSDRGAFRGDEVKAYYFEEKGTGRKRNTGVFAESAAAAKKKLKRPSPKKAKVYAVRSLNDTEKKSLKTGNWSRVRSSGKSPDKDPRGKGFFQS